MIREGVRGGYGKECGRVCRRGLGVGNERGEGGVRDEEGERVEEGSEEGERVRV